MYQDMLCNIGWAVSIYTKWCYLGRINIGYIMLAVLYEYRLSDVVWAVPISVM